MQYTATDIVLIIGAFFTGIALVIGTWKGNKKLDEIKLQTNGAAGTAAAAAATAADSLVIAGDRLEILQNQIKELNIKIGIIQERRLDEARMRGPLPIKVEEVKKEMADHDNWERENSKNFTAALAENTKLTKEIFKYLQSKS